MALRFQKQLGISLTFSISNSEPPKIAVSYVILDSEAKGIDVKIVSAGNVVYRNGSDIDLHARHPSESEGHRRRAQVRSKEGEELRNPHAR